MSESDMSKPLESYEILLCVSGGIACYKSADLTSKLVQGGADVHVAMTDAAKRFVTPLTFQALTRRAVFDSLWTASEDFRSQHLSLTENADLMIVAPATANMLGKMAGGIADDLVSTLWLSTTDRCPVLVAPAMNTRMWNAKPVQENVNRLRQYGVHFVGPEEGNLACGVSGAGRMSEPQDILQKATEILRSASPKSTRQ